MILDTMRTCQLMKYIERQYLAGCYSLWGLYVCQKEWFQVVSRCCQRSIPVLTPIESLDVCELTCGWEDMG